MTDDQWEDEARRLAIIVYGLKPERAWEEYMETLVDADLLKADAGRIAEALRAAYEAGRKDDQPMVDLLTELASRGCGCNMMQADNCEAHRAAEALRKSKRPAPEPQ